VRGHLFWIAVWVAIVGAGYLAVDRFLAPPPAAHVLGAGTREIAIPVARDGHYYLKGDINGVPLTFMVDTGATYVSVGARFATEAGLPQGIPGYFSTANGTVEGRIVKGQTVRVDAFQVAGLSVAVMPNHGADGLLGQNFLRRFELTQSDGLLRMRMRPEISP